MNFKTQLKSLSACVAAVFALSAHAQQGAPAPASASTPAASAVAIPAMQCEKPGDNPGIEPNQAQINRFQKKVDDYKLCVNAYAKSTGAKANEFADSARAYSAAANGAIEEYNAYVTALNAKAKGESGGARQGSTSDSKPKYIRDEKNM